MSIYKSKSISATAELRRRAEGELNAKASETGFSGTEDGTQRLVQELQVHRIELEMQNAELRQSRDELEKSLEKYTELYDLAPVGYFTLNRNGNISAVNLCGASSLGIERARLIGRRFGQFVTEEYRPAFISFLDTIFTSPGREECEVALQNERNLPLSVQIEAVAAGSGQECNLVMIDITKRKQMETELRESEQSFRTLAENSPNIIIRYDLECRRVYVNRAYELNTGKSYDQAVGVRLDFNWNADLPVEEYRSRLQETIETGVAAEMLLEWTKTDGHKVSHAIHFVAERGPAGKVTGCLAIGHNVTPLKEAEQRLTKLAANSPGAVYSYLLRPDGTSCMPYVSPRIEDLVGLRPETLALDFSEAFARIHPDDAARVQESIAESARTLSPWHAEFRIRHPEKGEIWLEGRSMPESQQDGALLWYGFLHDITERKRIHELLQAKRDQLATMSVELSLAEERERRRIASELHDHIGQTLLLGRIKLGTVADVFVSGSDKKTYGEILLLLDQTIRDVRSLTQQLNPPVLASLGIEAALEWLARRMEADYSLLVEFSADLNEKQLTEELSAVVYQSARELLINVTKHSGTSKARLTISRDADMLELAVEDQGVGFACLPDAGTNLPLDCSFGLFNIRQRIKFLGGSVIIDSTPGSGTRATIRVPVMVGR